jgi:putative peptidoglycan lipid II flippase
MGFATFLSRITGLVREQAIGILFGAGAATDTYQVAFRIPNLLRDLFAEGAMSASLVPTFTRARVEEGDRRAWRVAGLVFRVLFGVVAVLTMLGMIFAPGLVGLYADAYRLVPGKFELTVLMTRVMFPFFPLVSLAAAFMGILNACGVFFIPAFASAVFNLVSVGVGVTLALILMHTSWGQSLGLNPIVGVALGVLLGGLAQTVCQLPALYRTGYRFPKRASSDAPWTRDPALRRILWMMVPGTVGLAATQVNLLVNTILATSQPQGAVSWLGFAFRLMQFPIGIFGVSLAAATLPRVSRLWIARDLPGIERQLSQSLRQVFAINLPASAGLAFLGYPIIQMIFEYHRFTPEAAHATAMALAMYSVGLVAYSAVKVLVPACYALGNTRLPVISSVLSVAVTIALNLIMVGPFGYWGLALGTSLAAIFNAAFLLIYLRKLLREAGGGLKLWPLGSALLRYAVLALIMGVTCKFSHDALSAFIPDLAFGTAGRVVSRVLKVALVVIEGGAIVVAIGMLFGLQDITQVVDLFRNKLKKKLR